MSWEASQIELSLLKCILILDLKQRELGPYLIDFFLLIKKNCVVLKVFVA